MTITFERIGRHHSVEPLEVDNQLDADQVAEKVWRYARRFLASRDFEVNVDLASGLVSIGWGRFGSGRIEVGS